MDLIRRGALRNEQQQQQKSRAKREKVFSSNEISTCHSGARWRVSCNNKCRAGGGGKQSVRVVFKLWQKVCVFGLARWLGGFVVPPMVNALQSAARSHRRAMVLVRL